MTDWGVHMIDIVLLAMQQTDPLSVVAAGGKLVYLTTAIRRTRCRRVYQFPKWVLNWEHRFNNVRGLDGGSEHGAEFIGDKGSFIVDRNGYQYFPEAPDAEKPPSSRRRRAPTGRTSSTASRAASSPPRTSARWPRRRCSACWATSPCKAARRSAGTCTGCGQPGDVKHCISYEREYRKPWNLAHYT